ncbi:MAG: hypothetical protein AB8E87_11190 [Prochlorococcus sp.]|nr:hypothetical protein [Prochlorococcaceae cyanobacterium Fu_MAG_50]
MAHLIENNTDAPILKVRSISRDPRSRRRQRKLAKPEQWTTGYSGEKKSVPTVKPRAAATE